MARKAKGDPRERRAGELVPAGAEQREGWLEVRISIVDARGVDLQPRRKYNHVGPAVGKVIFVGAAVG